MGVLQNFKSIAAKELAIQYHYLIRHPLSLCKDQRPTLIVLDALDECSSKNDVKVILNLLLGKDEEGSTRTKLRVLVASRPEAHIRSVFYPTGAEYRAQVVLHDIDESVVRIDIQTYLKAEFSRLTYEFGLPKEWASEKEFERLVTDCGQFFEYAAVAVRFIGDENVRDPPDQLHAILDIKEKSQYTADGPRPYLNLDNLYMGILRGTMSDSSGTEHTDRIRTVIATILLLMDPMSVFDLATFLLMTPSKLRNALRNLHSVIIVPENDSDLIRVFHPSFPDFMKDPKRCTNEFLIDVPMQQNLVSTRCLKIMDAELHKIPVDDDRISDMAWPLRYACIYWPFHVSESNPDDDLVQKLQKFAGDLIKFRQWCFVRGFGPAQLGLSVMLVHLVRIFLGQI